MLTTTDSFDSSKCGTKRPVAQNPDADKVELARSLVVLDRSAADIKAGRTKPAKQAIEEIAGEFGASLGRRSKWEPTKEGMTDTVRVTPGVRSSLPIPSLLDYGT